VARARAGQGPTLLECVTYRHRSHCEVQTPEYNRDPAEMALWLAKDPIRRFEAQLAERGLLDDEGRQRVAGEVQAEVDDAIAYAEGSPFPAADEVADWVYAPEDPGLVVEGRG
jgi:pyruvate dehydrogenase E1 component alpha subunit